MSVLARWDPERQRRALRLMEIEPPVFRAVRVARRPEEATPVAPAEAGGRGAIGSRPDSARPAGASATVRRAAPVGPRDRAAAPQAAPRLLVIGLSGVAAEDPLLRGILRSLGVAMGEVVFAAEAGETTPALPPLHFGKSGMDVPSLPGLALLRADPRAKRTAWQETLRPLAGRMRKS